MPRSRNRIVGACALLALMLCLYGVGTFVLWWVSPIIWKFTEHAGHKAAMPRERTIAAGSKDGPSLR